MEEDTLQELRDIGEIQKVGISDFVNQIYLFTLQMNEYEKKAEDLLVNSTLKDKTTIQVVAELLEALDDKDVIIDDLREEVMVARSFK